MPRIQLDLPLAITVSGPLHIGTGFDRGLVQRTIVRTSAGDVYIPGATLKGKARAACEDLARLCGLHVCGLPRVALVTPNSRHSAARCLVCRVFGTPGGNWADGLSLYWDDALLEAGIRAASRAAGGRPLGQTVERTQVQLSRARGMAAEDRLFTSEFAAHGLRFQGRLSGWLEATAFDDPDYAGYYELSLLLGGLRLVQMLGGSRSRGAGSCAIVLPDEITVVVQGQTTPERYRLADVLAAIEALCLYEM